MADWCRAGQKFLSSLWIDQHHTGISALRDLDENAHQNRNSFTSSRQSQFFLWEHLIYDYNAYLNLRLLQFPKELLKWLSNRIDTELESFNNIDNPIPKLIQKVNLSKKWNGVVSYRPYIACTGDAQNFEISSVPYKLVHCSGRLRHAAASKDLK